MEAPVGESNLGFAKRLASPKKKTREKSISFLVLWLTSQKEIEENELRKVWKGLFYCVWHSDKAPVQADLIQRLASILEKLDISLALKFFKVFLTTMRREWDGIDRLRLDKFYLLLRKFLAHMFTALQRTGWHSDSTKKFMDILVENAFLATDQYSASGINLHYADIFVKELEEFLPLGVDTFKLLIEPFLIVCAHASDKSLLRRIKENVFNPLFDLGRLVITARQEGRPIELVDDTLGSLFLSLCLSSEAFKLASLCKTPQANRKLLYTLYTECDALEKLLEMSHIIISVPNFVSKMKKKRKKKRLGPACPIFKLAKKGTQHSLQKPLKKRMKTVLDEDMKNSYLFDKNEGSFMDGLKDFPKCREDEEAMPTDLREGNEVCVLEVKDQDKLIKRKKERPMKKRKIAQLKSGASEVPHTIFKGLGMDNLMVSKLEEQFDVVAGGASDVCSTPDSKSLTGASPQMSGKLKKKRQTSSGSVVVDNIFFAPSSSTVPSLSTIVKVATPDADMVRHSSGKVKRVRFALKKNLVWTPLTPLPAKAVRIPPSATPRGSALKKGLSPGPVVSKSLNNSNQQKSTLMWSPSPRMIHKVQKHVTDYVRTLFEQGLKQELKVLYKEELKQEVGSLLNQAQVV